MGTVGHGFARMRAQRKVSFSHKKGPKRFPASETHAEKKCTTIKANNMFRRFLLPHIPVPLRLPLHRQQL